MTWMELVAVGSTIVVAAPLTASVIVDFQDERRRRRDIAAWHAAEHDRSSARLRAEIARHWEER